MSSVTLDKPDNTEPWVLPSHCFLGTCWPCRTPGAFWPEGESRRGRGMEFTDEEGKGNTTCVYFHNGAEYMVSGSFTGGTWRDRTPRTGE